MGRKKVAEVETPTPIVDSISLNAGFDIEEKPIISASISCESINTFRYPELEKLILQAPIPSYTPTGEEYERFRVEYITWLAKLKSLLN